MSTLDPRVAQDILDTNAAGERDKADAAQARLAADPNKSIGGVEQTFNPVERWMGELPANASVGLLHLAVNTADSIKHFGLGVAQNFKDLVAPPKPATEPGAAPAAPTTPTVLPRHDHDDVYDVAKTHVLDFADSIARAQQERGGGGAIDQVTQTGIQLAVPFTGFAKLLGGLRGASAVGTFLRSSVASGATDVTALDPHAGRAADLLALARHTEGKLGDAMLSVAPDGSALNAYINYMTDRTNESDAAGRFKNVLDGLTMNAATSTLFHAAAVTLKGGVAVAKYAAANAGELGPQGLAAQRGYISFRSNNASGESPASLEAINRVAQEKAQGITRHILRPNDTVEPLIGVGAVDARAQVGDVIVQMQHGKPTIMDRGGLPLAHANGRVNAALSRGLLPTTGKK